MQVRTPQKSGLQSLWARAGQAGHLRLEVESARVAEQERSLAEARQHLEQWDYLVVDPLLSFITLTCTQQCSPIIICKVFCQPLFRLSPQRIL